MLYKRSRGHGWRPDVEPSGASSPALARHEVKRRFVAHPTADRGEGHARIALVAHVAFYLSQGTLAPAPATAWGYEQTRTTRVYRNPSDHACACSTGRSRSAVQSSGPLELQRYTKQPARCCTTHSSPSTPSRHALDHVGFGIAPSP